MARMSRKAEGICDELLSTLAREMQLTVAAPKIPEMARKI